MFGSPSSRSSGQPSSQLNDVGNEPKEGGRLSSTSDTIQYTSQSPSVASQGPLRRVPGVSGEPNGLGPFDRLVKET